MSLFFLWNDICMKTKLFPSFNEAVDLKDDIAKLRAVYEYRKQHINFSLSGELFETQKEIYDSMFENVKLGRTICLLRLSQMDDFEFFDTPSLQEMFKCAIKNPLKINQHFNIIISQALMTIVMNIYKNHQNFANLVMNHFKDDISLHTLFGLSTFPAIYGFFTTQETCKYGAEIIDDFLAKPQMVYLVQSMLASYFYCAHAFNNILWETFHRLLMSDSDYQGCISSEKFEEVLKKALIVASPHLTCYHTKILMRLYEISKSVCTKFLRNHLKFTFNSFFSGEHLFINEKVKQTASTVFLDIQSSELIDCFANGGTGFLHPRAPTPDESLRTPLVFSDRDVLVILEIFKEGPTLDRPLIDLQEASNVLFTNGYAPFVFDVYPVKYSPPKPQKLEAPHDIKRLWKSIRSYATDHSLSSIELLEEKKVAEELLKYGIGSETIEFGKNINDLETYIDSKMKQNCIEEFKLHMENALFGVAYMHVTCFLNENGINGGTYSSNCILNYIDDALKKVFADDSLANNKYSFELFRIVLDRFRVTSDSLISQLSLKVTRELAILMQTLNDFINEHQKEANEMRFFASNLRESFSCPIGQQFCAMLDFMRVVKQFAKLSGKKGNEEEELISKWFKVGIIFSSTNDVFLSFFLINTVITQYQSKVNFLKEDVKNLWVSFSKELISLLSMKNEILYLYFQYKFDQKPAARKRCKTMLK